MDRVVLRFFGHRKAEHPYLVRKVPAAALDHRRFSGGDGPGGGATARRVTAGDLVNAFVEPGPPPQTAIPPSMLDATRAANARELAGRMIATHLKTTLVIHNPDGTTTILSLFGKQKSRFGAPLHLDALVDAAGRPSYPSARVPTGGGPRAGLRRVLERRRPRDCR